MQIIYERRDMNATGNSAESQQDSAELEQAGGLLRSRLLLFFFSRSSFLSRNGFVVS